MSTQEAVGCATPKCIGASFGLLLSLSLSLSLSASVCVCIYIYICIHYTHIHTRLNRTICKV